MGIFASKVALVTGGSSGLGEATALKFAREGAKVVIAARRAEQSAQVVERIVALGSEALFVPTDVSRREDVERLGKQAVAEFGRIDVWINNAGVGALGPFERIPLELHEQVIRTDLLGTLYGSHVAYRQFLEQGRGTLINVSSELGRHTVPYYTSYAAAKHGVVGLGDALRQEIEQNGLDDIHVCTVMPTAHDTPFFDHAANYTGHEVQPIPPLYDVQKVVDTIVRLVVHPEDEVIVGAAGKIISAAHAIMRDPMEKMMAVNAYRAMIENSPPAANTRGNLGEPVEAGRGVSGGRRRS